MPREYHFRWTIWNDRPCSIDGDLLYVSGQPCTPNFAAERFRSRLSAGDVNQADLARLHGITRARVTQILNLLRLQLSDLVRRAAQIASERASPPTPEMLLLGLRQGFATAFDLRW